MNYVMYPQQIINRANCMVGVTEMINETGIRKKVQMDIAKMVAEELAENWPEDEGFGSSDGTYVVKDYLDSLIYMTNINYRTAWINNRLGVEAK